MNRSPGPLALRPKAAFALRPRAVFGRRVGRRVAGPRADPTVRDRRYARHGVSATTNPFVSVADDPETGFPTGRKFRRKFGTFCPKERNSIHNVLDNDHMSTSPCDCDEQGSWAPVEGVAGCGEDGGEAPYFKTDNYPIYL